MLGHTVVCILSLCCRCWVNVSSSGSRSSVSDRGWHLAVYRGAEIKMETLPLAHSISLANTYKKQIITPLRFYPFIHPSGGGYPGGGQYRGAGDVSTPPLGLPLHTVLCLQTLRGPKEEEEEEEERPEPARLFHTLEAPFVISPAREDAAYLTSPRKPQESRGGGGVKMTKKKRLWRLFS